MFLALMHRLSGYSTREVEPRSSEEVVEHPGPPIGRYEPEPKEENLTFLAGEGGLAEG